MAELIKYNAMCRAIEAAHRVDEVKNIRDQAVALEHYARQAQNTDNERQACEIRLRAERKAGQLLAQIEKTKGGRPSKTHSREEQVLTKGDALEELGISRKQSAQWEKLGAMSQRNFDLAIGTAVKPPSTAGVIRAVEQPKLMPVSKLALWLWGRLRDFERDMLDKNPCDVIETATPEMKDDIHTLAPRVAAWLKRIGANK